ncbi:hypothetical protein ES705_49348 [subsurface metagenome]
MAKIEFTKSANEGRHTFCGIFHIELDKDDLKKLSKGGFIKNNVQDENVDIDFIFFIKRR